MLFFYKEEQGGKQPTRRGEVRRACADICDSCKTARNFCLQPTSRNPNIQQSLSNIPQFENLKFVSWQENNIHINNSNCRYLKLNHRSVTAFWTLAVISAAKTMQRWKRKNCVQNKMCCRRCITFKLANTALAHEKVTKKRNLKVRDMPLFLSKEPPSSKEPTITSWHIYCVVGHNSVSSSANTFLPHFPKLCIFVKRRLLGRKN